MSFAASLACVAARSHLYSPEVCDTTFDKLFAKVRELAEAMVARLSQMRIALLRELDGSEAKLRFVNTRLILSVGIDLNGGGEYDTDPRKVKTALETLNKMGF